MGAREAKAETMISISGPDGQMTPPVDLNTFRKAVDQVREAKPMKQDPDFQRHNDTAYAVAADELRQFIERFEQLEAEKKDIAEQQKELMSEAKGRGYDTKIMRMIVALRKRKPDAIAEEEAVLEMYKAALGMAKPHAGRGGEPPQSSLLTYPRRGAGGAFPEERI